MDNTKFVQIGRKGTSS